MLEVKTVARGNSLAISLPSDTKFHFKKGQRWLMIPSEDVSSFTLVPRITDPYVGPADDDPMTEEWSGFDYSEVE
jgi:hypothetical protein